MAAVQVGRQFIGIELDPEYFEIATRRIVWAAGHLPTDDGEVADSAPAEVQARLF